MDYRKSRRLLTVTIIFFWASEYCHAPYFTPYLQTLGFASTAIGFMTGTYGFTQMLVRIPLGMATDATGSYRRTILMGTILTTVSSFGLMFATTMVPILICRMLAGMAASTWLAFTILYNAYYKADESVQAMTNINAYNNTGKFIAFILGLITASLWGYKIPLVCSFLTGVVAIVCASRLKPIALKHEPFSLQHAAKTVTNPAVLCAAAFAIVLQFFLQGTVFSFTSAVAQNVGANAVEIGLATVLFTVVQIVGARYLREPLSRMSAAKAVTIGCASLAVSGLFIGLAPSVWLIYPGQIAAGVGSMVLNSVLMSMVIRHTPQERQSTAMGMYQAVYGIGMAEGPVVVGALVSGYGYGNAYLTVAALMAVATLAAPWAISKADKTQR